MEAGNNYPSKDAAYAAGVRTGLKHADEEHRAVETAAGEGTGASKPPIKTLADIRNLTPSQVNEHWDAVQRVLGAS